MADLEEVDDQEPLSGLSIKQERAIIALINEPNVPKAAEKAEVGERTLYRWLKLPNFKAELRTARRESFTQAIAMCNRYAPLAINAMAKVISDSDAPHHAKVAAAAAILKFAREGIELDDLAARVEQLELTTKSNESRTQPWRSQAA